MGAETTTSSVGPAARDDCPPDEVLAVHLEGELAGAEAERVAAHIDDCDACRELVVVLARQMRIDRDTVASQPFPSIPGVPKPLAIDLTPPSLPGAFAGRYQIKRMIGRGAMGQVFEALDLNLHRLIALKVLRLAPDKSPAERAEAANRLVREARAMAVLSHRNVVAVYDVGQHADQVFVAMQLVDGATLRKWLAAQKRTPRQIIKVMCEAGIGLAAAHQARLIHRDFKPDNILISRRGTARVTDFGLARRAEFGPDPLGRSSDVGAEADRGSRPVIVEIDTADSHDVTRTGAVVGTPAYMAPEQARGQDIDARADQFSFCVATWEALYGDRPFAGTTWSEIYGNVVTGRMTEPDSDEYVPRQIQRALRRGLAADPAARWPSMRELLAEFDQVLKRPGRVKRVAMIAGIAAAAAAIAVLIYNQGQKIGEVPEPRVAVKASLGPQPSPGSSVEPVAMVTPTPAPAPTPTPTPPPPGKRHHDPKPGTAAVATTTTTAVGPEPVHPAADPRAATLADERKALGPRWKQRGLLASDLPAAYTDAVKEVDAALASGDYDRAETELGTARAAIDGIVIDFAFVNRKLNRLNDRITDLPADQRDEYATLLQALSASVKAGDYPAANRKLDEIAAKLGFEK